MCAKSTICHSRARVKRANPESIHRSAGAMDSGFAALRAAPRNDKQFPHAAFTRRNLFHIAVPAPDISTFT